ncbi:ribose-phosphate diphosphokinase [Natrinema caseinilyticum]|uniref:ribose-phosphate diphosphokinase n=1 Tax=Natrinema caseinilyticum TaxID=2961570 RepID=UPI0020C59136|nr:ribose-phosphate diphosphokinase [Natrinema caseinilyticum]
MDIIVTPSAEHLEIDAVQLDSHPQNESRLFPDGEVYVQLESVDDVDAALVVHSGQPHPNRGLAYLSGLLELLTEHDVLLSLCFTYVPYGMQDESFYPGTLNYARALLNRVTRYPVRQVYAVDPHFSHRDWAASFPITHLHAFPLVQERVNEDLDDFVVVGPDLGAVDRFGIPGFEKTRSGAYEVELEGELDVEGRNVLVFDDLIETGGTMVAAYDRLTRQGADTVVAAAVHGVVDEGIRRVRDTYDGLYLTNSIARDAANVSIEPLVRTVLE